MVAHYCSPYRGSDWWVGWGRVVQAAENFQVWVITSTRSRDDIERYLAQNGPIANLAFIYLGAEATVGLMSKLPVSYLYVNPFAYGTWQKKAGMLAKELHREHRFDLTHHVNLIGFREPGSLWELDVPFIWGPIGGTQICPWRFLSTGSASDVFKEVARTFVNFVQLRYSKKVHQALKHAAVVLVANSDAKRQLGRYRPDSIQLLETGLDSVGNTPTKKETDRPLRILWSGEIQFRKALHILLRALAKVEGRIDYEVRILGKGSHLERTKALAAELGLAGKCQFMGWLPLEQAKAQSDWADVFVFTSLRDTSGNVMLEAMSRGVPVITFDHQGAGDIVTNESGVKIPVTSPDQSIAELSDAIVALGKDRERLAKLSKGALQRAEQFLWQRNAAEMVRVYRSALKMKMPQPMTTSHSKNLAA
jgi:glycosyltransferase involved in cell wall biosynthesis